ncbi:MAG: 16S rRNA (uracil(1498)-N(3))-methyltransferase [Clostridia bacterium]|nr:16S rRNA (uracil(1498)-N(3))-methyltransferase [Clostridia bacterium]
MHRFYVDSENCVDDVVTLSDEDARHACVVLRMKPGQEAEIVVDGVRWSAEMLSVSPRDVRLKLLSVLPSTEPSLSVTLYQGLPKSDKMDMIMQKAVELGVTRIVPVLMERSVSRPDPKDSARKLERWRKIVREAGKQSGRCLIPRVSGILTLKEVLSDPDLPSVNIVPWENTDGFGPLAFRNAHSALSSLGILIGPEGGIDQEEISLLQSSGFIPVTLGKRILRTETAGLAAVSAIMCLYGEME